jgi:hypothetical protein
MSLARTSLKQDKLEVKKTIESKTGLTLGSAIDTGDCFFDALAQALENQGVTIPGDVNVPGYKRLRLMCHDYFQKLSVMPGNWVQTALLPNKLNDERDTYTVTLNQVQYTYLEMDQMSKISSQLQADMFKASPELFEAKKKSYLEMNKKLGNSYVTWGRPAIEGRILCELFEKQLGVSLTLHVIDNHALKYDENNPENEKLITTHYGVRSTGQFKIEKESSVENNNPKWLHMANYRGHFVPLLASEAKNENIVELRKSLEKYQEHLKKSQQFNTPLAQLKLHLTRTLISDIDNGSTNQQIKKNLHDTYTSQHDVNGQLLTCSEIFQKSRDSTTDKILKCILTAVTFGIAVIFGLWNVKGEAVSNEIKKVDEKKFN